jgi:hypothetical protein
MKQLILLFSVFLFGVSNAQTITYTVDPSGNGTHTTIQGALDAINGKSLNNNVVIDIESGTYNEKLTLEDIQTNGRSLTIQSKSNNANSVTIQNTNLANVNDQVLVIKNVENVQLKWLTFGSGSLEHEMISLGDGAENVLLDQLVFKNNRSLQNEVFAVGGYVDFAVFSGSIGKLTIQNSSFQNVSPYRNQYVFTYKPEEINFNNCLVTDQNESVWEANDIIIKANDFKDCGIGGVTSFDTLVVSKNKVRTAYDVFTISALINAGTKGALIANNFFISDRSRNIDFFNLGQKVQIINNTFVANYRDESCIFFSSVDSIELFNNIFYSEGQNSTAYAFFDSTYKTASLFESDYNCYYFPNGSIWKQELPALKLYDESEVKNLGFETKGVFSDPIFRDDSTAIVNSAELFNAGKAFAFITDDINNQPRINQPDIGAHEIKLIANLQAKQISQVRGILEGGRTVALDLTMRNDGKVDIIKPWTNKYYLSSDSLLDKNDQLLKNETYDFRFESESDKKQWVSAALPLVPAGNYYFIAVGNADSVGFENVFADNEVVSGPHYINYPDLANLIVDSIITPSNQFSGKTFELTYTVKNIGNAPTTGGWMDYIYVANNPTLLNNLNGRVRDSLLLTKRISLQSLDFGESYSNTINVQVPLRYSGNIYYRVQANANYQVFEQDTTFKNNGKTSKPISVTQSPLPDLSISNFSIAKTAFSGEKIPVSWIVKNVGNQKTFRFVKNTVNTRRNRFDFYQYWFDAVYISRKPFYDVDEPTQRSILTIPSDGELDINEQYTISDSVSLKDCDYGKYYVFATTNITETTYELGYSNNVSVIDSLEVIIDPKPDLIPTALEVDNVPASGQNIRITYTVKNDGFSDKKARRSSESFYLSSSENFEPKNAVFLGYDFSDDSLAKGNSMSKTVSFKLPFNVFGNYYLFHFTDAEDNICEANKEGNNSFRTTNLFAIELSDQPDLVPVTLNLADTLIAGNTYPVTIKVENKGIADVTESSWSDILRLNNEVISKRPFPKPLNASMSYVDTIQMHIPIDYEEGSAEVTYTADGLTQVFEYGLEENNELIKKVIVKRDFTKVPDFVVESLKVLNTGLRFGDRLQFEYELSNLSANYNGSNWHNQIEIYNNVDELIYKEEFRQPGRVFTNQTNTFTSSIKLPHKYGSGSYRIELSVNNRKYVPEYIYTNNSASATVNIDEYFAPDLEVVDLYYNPSSQQYNALEQVSLTVEVRNNNHTTSELLNVPVNFKVFLSKDREGSNPKNVVYFTKVINLTKQKSADTYTVELIFNYDVEGEYFTHCEIDYDNQIYEAGQDENNQFASSSTIVLNNKAISLYPEFIEITSSTNPLNDLMRVRYEVRKEQPIEFKRRFQDQLILSKDKRIDGSDYRFAEYRQGKLRDMQANDSLYKDEFLVLLPNYIQPGWYFVGVLCDANNNVLQTSEEKNLLFTKDSIYIDFSKDLTLDQLDTGYFYEGTRNGSDIYSLNRTSDKGMLVTLDFDNDDVSSELYHKVSAIPTSTIYDTKFSNPFLADQQLIVGVTDTSTTDYFKVVGTEIPWYKSNPVDFSCYLNSAISNRGSGGVVYLNSTCDLPKKSDYTIIAETRTYSLESIFPDTGSVYGTTSVAVRGFDLANAKQLYLVNGTDTIFTQQLSIIDATYITGHFDLRRKQLGNYNVVVINNQGLSATLRNGFTIDESPTVTPVANVNTHVETQLVGQPLTVNVDFGNAANSNGYDYWLLVAFANQGFNTSDLNTQYIGSSEEEMYRLFENHDNPPLDSAFVDIDGVRYYAYWVPILPARSRTTFTYKVVNNEEGYTASYARLIRRPLSEYSFNQDPASFARSATILELVSSLNGISIDFKTKSGSFNCDDINIAEVEKELLQQTWAVGKNVSSGAKAFTGVKSIKEAAITAFTNLKGELKDAVDVKGNATKALKDQDNLRKLLEGSIKGETNATKDYLKKVLDSSDPKKNIENVFKPNDPPFKDVINNVFGCLDTDKVATKIDSCVYYLSEDKVNKSVAEVSGGCKRKYGIKNSPSNGTVTSNVNSFDPNEIVGPEGTGEQRFIEPEELLDYTIYFENVSTATAPARFVSIDNPLDSNFRLQDFYLTSLAFGDTLFEFEPTNSLNTTLALGPKYNNKNLNIVAGIDVIGSRAIWRLSTVEPTTGALVMSPFDGFLPPNDSTNIGQGYVTYTIRANEETPPNTVYFKIKLILFSMEMPS